MKGQYHVKLRDSFAMFRSLHLTIAHLTLIEMIIGIAIPIAFWNARDVSYTDYELDRFLFRFL